MHYTTRFLTALSIASAMVMTNTLPATDAPVPKRVLFFSKAASWEHKIVHRYQREEPSYIEQAVAKLGRENHIDFTFSKDGTIFTAANLAKFDALFFYTSGDLTFQQRNGRGDNFPLMTLEGKHAFLDAVENGLGFVACNTANYTFTERLSPGEKSDATNSWRFTRMIGAGYMGHNEVQPGVFSYIDRKFPGMESMPLDYHPVDQWYAFNRLMPDLHVIMALDAHRLTGNLYERESYPVAWARMQGMGRVFYTTMGHAVETWRDPAFLQMLLGGISWATKRVNADVTPDIATVTPHANEYPPHASKFISEHPPVVDPHFPNFKVWLDQPWPMHGGKRVLVYTKSAGVEPPFQYRDTAWPSPLESELLKFGDEHRVDFVFSKDATQFTPDNLASFDAILLCVSGNPCRQERDGLGDNDPLLPESGVQALVDAVRGGKGCIAVHTAFDGITTSLLGATKIITGEAHGQKLRVVDSAFPGMSGASPSIVPSAETFAVEGLRNDAHLLLTTDDSKPVAWARVEGKGRVYFTSLNLTEETWRNARFREMLLGAIQWATREVDAKDIPAAR